MLHTEIKYHNPDYQGDGQFQIQNGKPIAIGLRGTPVKNLRFLEKIELLALDLSDTPAQDLGPLRGQKLVELYLEDSQAIDLTAIRGEIHKRMGPARRAQARHHVLGDLARIKARAPLARDAAQDLGLARRREALRHVDHGLRALAGVRGKH